jgi:hypothetical protein
MNAEEMIESALIRSESERLEGAFPGNPDDAARAERLRQSINRLLDDGAWIEPPPDLAARTLAYVARNRRRTLTFQDYIPIRVPFRWPDLAVAASIFIAGMLTLLPAIQRSRERMNQAGCVFNLQQLGSSLAQYASLHQFLPYPPPHRSDTHAGMFAVILHDAGMLQDLSLLDCPCNGPCAHSRQDLAAYDQVEKIRRTDPDQYRQMLRWDYSYNVGYRDGTTGRPMPVAFGFSAGVPVISDSPDHDENFTVIRAGNSPNHARRGQNVLFGDFSVRWLPTRRANPVDLDIFLNNAHQPAPGLDVRDSVLMPSKMPFFGR